MIYKNPSAFLPCQIHYTVDEVFNRSRVGRTVNRLHYVRFALHTQYQFNIRAKPWNYFEIISKLNFIRTIFRIAFFRWKFSMIKRLSEIKLKLRKQYVKFARIRWHFRSMTYSIFALILHSIYWRYGICLINFCSYFWVLQSIHVTVVLVCFTFYLFASPSSFLFNFFSHYSNKRMPCYWCHQRIYIWKYYYCC